MNKKPKDFFASIADYPHDIGIYLTYTLDNEVIEKLSTVSSGAKIILHDYRQGICLSDNGNSSILCIPVATISPNEKNCFHAKLALLKKDTGAKLIVGSANLSVDSFVNEKEIALEIELVFNEATDVYIYNQVLAFFRQLSDKQTFKSSAWEKIWDRLYYRDLPSKEKDIDFIFNTYDQSIFNHVQNHLAKHRKKKKAKRIKVVTPFVSEHYRFFSEFVSIAESVSIYTRKGAKITPFIYPSVQIFQPRGKKTDGFHAKMVLIEYEKDAVLFIGSANFTEQGFFKNLEESGNQECGIVLRVSLQEMEPWFSETNWVQLSDIDIEAYEEDKDNPLEFFENLQSPYAWANKETNQIATYIFNPQSLPVSVSKGGKRITLESTAFDDIYRTNELKEVDQMVRFFIGNEQVSVSVFDEEELITTINQRSGNIFNLFKGVYSIYSKEVDQAIESANLTARENMRIAIAEPPKLEQYFYNVKQLITHLQSKKYFSEYETKQFIKAIHDVGGGRTLYLTVVLLKYLYPKPFTETLINACTKRIEELANELNLDGKALNEYLKVWLTSNN